MKMMLMMFVFLFRRGGGGEGWEREVEERGCIYNEAKYLVGNYRETKVVCLFVK